MQNAKSGQDFEKFCAQANAKAKLMADCRKRQPAFYLETCRSAHRGVMEDEKSCVSVFG